MLSAPSYGQSQGGVALLIMLASPCHARLAHRPLQTLCRAVSWCHLEFLRAGKAFMLAAYALNSIGLTQACRMPMLFLL